MMPAVRVRGPVASSPPPLEEPVVQRACRTRRGADEQQAVTEQLGYQVRQAVEVLLRALDKADQDHGRQLLQGVDEKVLYEAALTVLMRLVFLVCAEERDLLLLGDELYDKNYAVSALREQLAAGRSEQGDDLLNRRFDAWPRLLTTFRAIHAGAEHDRLKLPAYGGSLFHPDRFPFLEGRLAGTTWRDTEATPLPVSNRTVLHLLAALQVLQVRLPGGATAARHLRFRALDIEQIGHVYEGLLDHTARRATEPLLGLAGTRDKEPELALAELEQLAARGEKELLQFLKEETGRSEAALKKGLKVDLDGPLTSRFRTACQDAALWKRVQPFAGLVRLDAVGYPVIITAGSVFVTGGTNRRSSGTHYTPKSLTEPIVQYTLEPLVYVGPAAGLPKNEWKLKPARDLLSLRICDLACGSGAFLVQACRYLAARLQEAWEQEEAQAQGHLFTQKSQADRTTVRLTPAGAPAAGGLYEQLVPLDPDERQTCALRSVAQRCLYGVDKNPLAVEMAKLSLWLLTLAKGQPFDFLDHALRCGDALVGLHSLDQLRKFHLDGQGTDKSLVLPFLEPRLEEAIALRRQLTEMQTSTVEDVAAQARLLREANEKIDRLKCAADLLIAAEFVPGSVADKRAARLAAASQVAADFHCADLAALQARAQRLLNGRLTFHWPLEFPEICAWGRGFDAFLGNPPFINAIAGELDGAMKAWLSRLRLGLSGTADFSCYFLALAESFTQPAGAVGMIMPRPFLNARAAASFRRRLQKERPPTLLHSPEQSARFAFANVKVTAVVLARGGQCRGGIEGDSHPITIDSDNWWSCVARKGEAHPTRSTSGTRLRDHFDLAASMTAQAAYEVRAFLEDRSDTPWPRLVTTGLIDPFECLWGQSKCRYLKADYAHPVVRPAAALPKEIAKRLEQGKRPKVLVAGVAGPGGRLEAFVDANGLYCGAVSTYTITHRHDSAQALESLCQFLNGAEVAGKVFSELNASSMGSGLLTIKKDFLADLLLPNAAVPTRGAS